MQGLQLDAQQGADHQSGQNLIIVFHLRSGKGRERGHQGDRWTTGGIFWRRAGGQGRRACSYTAPQGRGGRSMPATGQQAAGAGRSLAGQE